MKRKKGRERRRERGRDRGKEGKREANGQDNHVLDIINNRWLERCSDYQWFTVISSAGQHGLYKTLKV